jgi:hypothetical protein
MAIWAGPTTRRVCGANFNGLSIALSIAASTVCILYIQLNDKR